MKQDKKNKKSSLKNKNKRKVLKTKKDLKKEINIFSEDKKMKNITERIKNGQTKIKVIGVGGGGGNIVTRMMNQGDLKNVEFIVINTDVQDLNTTRAHKKLCIGRALTKGLGAGMNPEIGRQAAEENKAEIEEVIDEADIVFLTAGFGGGTGTGATPVIAEILKEKNILTIAIITKPFSFEGAQRMNIALEGINRVKDKVDALVVIPNDRIFYLIDKETSVAKAFSYVDDVLKNAVQAIAEIINSPGIINVDFADIKAIMKDTGTTLVGVGIANGQDRALKALQLAINSPLLESSIEGAKGLLFAVAGGRDLKMVEINEIATKINSLVDNNAKIIFGAYYDYKLKEKQIKVTVIATGFNGLILEKYQTPNLFFDQLKPEKKDSNYLFFEKEEDFKKDETLKKMFKKEKEILINKEEKKETKEEEEKDKNDWEIPSFLRRKKK